MSKIPIHTEIDASTLLAGVEKLNINELEAISRALDAIIFRRKSETQLYREQALLKRLNNLHLSHEHLARIQALANRLEMETMTSDEHREYMALVAEEEQLRNQRVQVLLELSQLRGVSLPQIMEELGLISPGRA